MITKKQVRECKSAAKAAGYDDVKSADIAYITVCKTFEDKGMAYKLLFRDNEQLTQEEYDASEKMVFLRRYVDDLIRVSKGVVAAPKMQSDNTTNDNISFDENLAGAESQIAEILELKKQLIDENGVCTDVKSMAILQKIEMDARAKLIDKFNIKEQITEQLVIVQPKFNHICEQTQKECWLQTKEFAMAHWHLIDDPNYKE